ncbi:TM2 domain-containing protein [Bifidobacterium subtile]|jgi:TM2 domain-containing membrane protein YozV|uniref:TM2 domain-containing protein n=2 Tax=Bifidobacterium subtile TaxID=77635 RepID=A0A087EAD0_9BIFI|nr:TM2 domain-containing protein [Bifidobacterium subtile]QOL35813.1 TM2 domain-containing protein [Bifidobacterium subtile]
MVVGMSDFNADNGQQQYPDDGYAQTPQEPAAEQPQPTQQQYAAGAAGQYGYANPDAGPNEQPQYSQQQPYGAYQGAYSAPGQNSYAQGGQPGGPAQGQPGQQWGAQSSQAYGTAPYMTQPYGAGQEIPYGYIPRQKLVAGLLGIFLGCFGVHNFYLGNTGKAVAQLLLTLIGWIVLFGPFVSWVWGLIEGILILCANYGSPWHRDALGVELRD